jgi:Flp pilus assembly protein TadG
MFRRDTNVTAMSKRPSLVRKFLRFLQGQGGQTAVSFAVAAPAVIGALGVAVDFGMVTSKHAKLQTAADQAAIAAARELTIVKASPESIQASADVFARAAINNPDINLTVETAVGSGKDHVRVTLTEKWTPFFAHFLGAQMTPIVVNATGKLAGKSNLCLLALNSSRARTLRMDFDAQLRATGCAVYSDSSNAESIRLDRNSTIEAGLVCAVGGINARTTAITPQATTDCPAISDPLANRTEPSASACDFTNLAITSGVQTLNPGTYCGGLRITNDAEVTFSKGDYVIRDGKFYVTKNAKITGENVAFYLQGELATLQFLDDTTVSLSGASEGPMAGMLFFEDRSVTLGRVHRINSANAHTLTGTIYLARGELRVDPNTPVAQNSAYTAIIANTVDISAGPTLVLNDDYNATNVPVPEGIKIGQEVVLSE